MGEWSWIVGLYLFAAGMLFAAFALNWRVETCEASTPARQCIIDVGSHGINLVPAQSNTEGK